MGKLASPMFYTVQVTIYTTVKYNYRFQFFVVIRANDTVGNVPNYSAITKNRRKSPPLVITTHIVIMR